MTAIFMTATGTDVGKTAIAAALIRYLRQMGHEVDAIKPIACGFEAAQAATSDPGILLAALGLPCAPNEIERITPWRFRAALAPDLAAKGEGRSIDVERVIAFCRDAVERHRDILLIDGVGGIMVPLDEYRTMLDVMMALALPLILVTGSYPGAISHTLTALDSLFRRDMNVLATIVSETPGSTLPLEEVVATVARFTEPVIALPRPQRQGGDPGAGGAAAFGRLFGGGAKR